MMVHYSIIINFTFMLQACYIINHRVEIIEQIAGHKSVSKNNEIWIAILF